VATVQGTTYKRCPCPVRRDRHGRRMACSKSHGSWTYHVDVPATDGRKRRQVTKGGFPTRKAAKAALAEFLGHAARGEVAVAGRHRTGDYLDEWLAGMRPTLAASAWTNYRSLLHLYVQPRIGTVRLSAVSASMLTALYADLLAGGGKNGKPLSPTTVRLVHRILSKALGDAVESHLLAVNPAQHAKVPARQRVEMQTWTAEQASIFLRAAAGDRLYAAWLLALSCGLRRGELCGLRWSDVDLERQTLSVVSQRTTDADWQVITKEPKGTSRRIIDLGAAAVAALRAHRKKVLTERLEWGGGYTDSGLVFVREDGMGYHPSRLTDLFQSIARAAGVPVIRLHDARHSCATLALAAGIHPKVVQQLLGHASLSTTMDLYTHRVERLQKDATGRIESVLFGNGTGAAAST
jgi:integrase